MFTPGSKLDDAENRWRRLAELPRERRCIFRCSTDSISSASAAVYRLTLIASLAVAAREHGAERSSLARRSMHAAQPTRSRAETRRG
jgi:hypothetical protein